MGEDERRPIRPVIRSWGWSVSVIAVGIAAGIGLLYFVYQIIHPLALVILAMALAAALSPVVNWLQLRMRRGFAILVTYILLLAVIAILLRFIVPGIIDQVRAVISSLPDVAARWEELADVWLGNVNASAVMPMLGGGGVIGQDILRVPISIFDALSSLIVLLFLSLYMLLSAPSIETFIHSLLPEDSQQRWWNTLSRMAQAMGGYYRGVLINCFLIWVAATTGLMIIGINYALFLGTLAGALEIIPIFGPIITWVIIVLVALAQSPSKALFAAIYFLLLQQIEGHILVPFVMRSQTRTPPLLVILALLVGAVLGGVLGVLVAIPIATSLVVFADDVIAPSIRKYTHAVGASEDLPGPPSSML